MPAKLLIFILFLKVMQELRQLETWLFTLLSSPVPVPGNTKLLLEV